MTAFRTRGVLQMEHVVTAARALALSHSAAFLRLVELERNEGSGDEKQGDERDGEDDHETSQF